MAVLSDNDRQGVWSKLMRLLSSRRETLDLSKADLRAAVNAVDQWVDDNAGNFNSAIPLPARTNLTAKQKSELLACVVLRRFEVS